MSAVLEQSHSNELSVINTDNLVLDEKAMNHMMNVATFMSGGTLTLPEPYRKNPANCLAVVMQAAQWKMNPFAVAQKTHFVNGTIGYEAQLVAAAINQSGATRDNFHFEWYGDWPKILGKFKEVESKTKTDDKGFAKKYKFPDWPATDEVGLGVKVWATLRGENEPRNLDLLLTQANVRNSTLWADDPRQQLAYLAQKRWARLYTPGVILGVYTADEIQDGSPQEKDVTPMPRNTQTEPAPTVYYTDQDFIENTDRWKKTYFKGVKSGSKTEEFFNWVDTKSVKKLTASQKEEITLWVEPGPVVVEGEATKVQDDFVTQMNQAESEK